MLTRDVFERSGAAGSAERVVAGYGLKGPIDAASARQRRPLQYEDPLGAGWHGVPVRVARKEKPGCASRNPAYVSTEINSNPVTSAVRRDR
jgi:hypothetical protein